MLHITHASLLEFYMNFEGVIDAQRHNQSKRDVECEGYLPELKTPLELEHHAATTNTITIFFEVQKEIIGGYFNCRVIAIRGEGELTMHIFFVFKDVQLVSIPGQYIVPRWTQHPTTMPMIDSGPSLYDQNFGRLSAKSYKKELWREIYACIGLVGNNTYHMSRMAQVLQEMKAELLSNSNGHEQVKGNKSAIETFCGL
nr:protein FAR1-RELATED SEQUENCE 5-like [Ipomoea batatas]